MNFTTPAAPVAGYFSLPLTADPTYTGVVSAVATNTISVATSPWTSGALATAAAPYFVKFLSGSQSGRCILVTANTTNTLTLDTSDHNIGSVVALNTTNFSVQTGDTFEMFPGDTLATLFGNNTVQYPLLLTGSTSISTADTVSTYTTSGAPTPIFYFNTTAGYWEQSGTTVSANNVIVYPYSTFTITRGGSEAGITLVLTGRVAEVARLLKVLGRGTTDSSTGYLVDVSFSSLNFGSNWISSSSTINASTLSLLITSVLPAITYWQVPDSTWRKYPDLTTDQGNALIPGGTSVTYTMRNSLSGAASFLQPALPYSLDPEQ
jgi:uncharacterized protein (TIGR02597 family)